MSTARGRLVLLLAAASACLLLTQLSSASAERRECPRYQKVCSVVGDPPVKGQYVFAGGGGNLTVGQSGSGYFFQDFELHLKQAAGCSLAGRNATVTGSHPLRKKGKSAFVGVEETETTFTWRLFKNYVSIKVGNQTFRGRLFAKFTNLQASGGPQMVEGYLKFSTNTEELCRQPYRGKP